MATAFPFSTAAFDFNLPLFASIRPHATLLASSAVLAYASLWLFRWRTRNDSSIKPSLLAAALQQTIPSTPSTQLLDGAEEHEDDHPYPEIEPLTKFYHATTAPEKIRPYKPTYHLTMGVQNNSADELLLIDKYYVSRLAQRRRILQSHSQTVLGHLPESLPAVQEFYSYMFSHYLPSRFPTLFTLSPSGTLLYNQLTQQCSPVAAPSATQALRTLAENVEDDFAFLLPDPEEEGAWRVVAFDMLFPSGFDMRAKLGWRMKEIHAAIPGLEAKLGPSINRFFGKMKPGVENGVKRVNWSIARTPELFTPSGSHVYNDEEADMGREEDVDVSKCNLRCERQVLLKLPQSGAIVFGIRTYMTPLSELKKEEGEAERLIEAIEGIRDDIARYKGRNVWGPKVLEFLRS